MTWTRRLVDGSFIDQADMDLKSIQQQMETVKLEDGSSLRVFDLGHGEPIIFLPMVTELNFVYALQLEEFRTDYRVILYEPRLSRQSHFGIADRANEVVSLMKALELESAHIVAWSDVGSAAYYLAKQWPKRCQSVVFLGLADRYKFPPSLQFLTGVLAKLPVEILESLVPPGFLPRILGEYLGGAQVKPAWVAQRAAQIPQLLRLFKHSVLPNLIEHRPKAGEVKVPSIIVCGDSDALVTVEQARRMATLLPKAGEAVIISGGEHFLGYVNASPVNKVMRDFYAVLREHSN